MRSRLLSLALIGGLLAPALAVRAAEDAQPTREERLDALLQEHRRPFTFDGSKLAGPGADALLAEAAQAEMLLVGESHGNRETPQLVQTLLPALRTRGYGVFAIETGPVTADLLVSLARQDEVGAFIDFLERFPFTFPFFWWREEAVMLRDAVTQDYAVWGLDQEFAASARYLLHRLAGHLDEAGKEALAPFQTKAQEGFDHFLSTGSSEKGFLQSITAEEVETLRRLAPAGNAEATLIVEEIAATAKVYQHYEAGRYFANNRDRIELMKRHFLTEAGGLSGLAKAPKILMKFGAAHMARGYSPFDQLDLGNQAAELSFARGGDSLHLLVLSRWTRQPDGMRQDLSGQLPALERLDAQRLPDGWTLFDLRELRSFLSPKANEEAFPHLYRMAFGFDFVALAPEFHPADAMVDLPF